MGKQKGKKCRTESKNRILQGNGNCRGLESGRKICGKGERRKKRRKGMMQKNTEGKEGEITYKF